MTVMKKILSVLAFAAVSIWSLHALPADPTPRTIRQKDGTTVTLVLHGDEYHHWYTNLSGMRYVAGSDGIFRPASKIPTKSGGSSSYGKRRLTKSGTESSFTKGDKKFLVVLIEFNDLAFTIDRQEIDNMLNQKGYSSGGATGSVFDYYYENSSGQFNPHWDVVGPIKVAGNMADYGKNESDNDQGSDVNPGGLLAESIDIIHSQGLANFRDYDNDGDGYAENVYFFYAGYGEAVSGSDPNTIWPHSSALYGNNTRKYDGVTISSYACGPEFKGLDGGQMDGIGTFCHEFGHVLGLPDFYDTDYEESGGENEGLGVFSLMANGCYNNDSKTPPLLNAEERVLLGWMDPSAIKTIKSDGSYTLQSIDNNVAYKTPSGTDGEYYLYECRNADNKWDSAIKYGSSDSGVSGMLIYHVDKSTKSVGGIPANKRWENWNGINAVGGHPCFAVVPAKQASYLISDVVFPGSSGKTEFSDLSRPRSENWAGEATCYNLYSIDYSGGVSSFTLKHETARKVLGNVCDSKGNPISGATISVSVASASSAAVNTKGGDGKQMRSTIAIQRAAAHSVTTDSNGNYSVTLGDGDGNDFELVISKEGYKPFEKSFTLTKGRTRIDATLFGVAEEIKVDLEKYGTLGETVGLIGWNQHPDDISVAIKFSADELSRYAGMKISFIAFMFFGTAAEEVDAIIESGGERQLTYSIRTPGYFDGQYVNWSYADIEDENYVIPYGEDLYIGYALKQVEFGDDGYPIVVSSADDAEGDGYFIHGYSTSAGSWTSLGDDNGTPVIAVRLVEDKDSFDEGRIIVIINPSSGAVYKAGTTFNFALKYGEIDEPESVVWYYDGAEQSASSVKLTSGRHEVKALVTFADGAKEEIIQIIRVK